MVVTDNWYLENILLVLKSVLITSLKLWKQVFSLQVEIGLFVLVFN